MSQPESSVSEPRAISPNGVSHPVAPVPDLQTPALKHEENGNSSPAKRQKTAENTPSIEDIKHNGPPVHEVVGGSSVRQYLNQHLTEHLLEGLRTVSRTKPEDPLRELGQFLIARSDAIKAAADES